VGRFQRSLTIAKASWRTLLADRELLALPVLSFFVSLLAFAGFGALVFLVDYESSKGIDGFELSNAGTLLLVLAGITMSIVTTFFQAAMVGGARERLTGGDPTLSSALGVAFSRLSVIIPWAVFSWTIGALLRAIEERAGFVGRIIISFLGMAFRVVTFLAVPILVVEELGPIDTLKRSGTLFRQTWGENLIAQFGLGLITMLGLVPILVVAALIGAATNIVVAVVVAAPLVGTLIVVMTSLTAIYQTALYYYVTSNQVPTGFEGAGLEQAFQQR
jgi:hypothetical protein